MGGQNSMFYFVLIVVFIPLGLISLWFAVLLTKFFMLQVNYYAVRKWGVDLLDEEASFSVWLVKFFITAIIFVIMLVVSFYGVMSVLAYS